MSQAGSSLLFLEVAYKTYDTLSSSANSMQAEFTISNFICHHFFAIHGSVMTGQL